MTLFRRMARRTVLALLSLPLLAAGSPAWGALDLEDARPLPWTSTEGLLFFVDAVSFPGLEDSGAGRTEFVVRVPLGALALDESLGVAMEGRLRVKIKNQRGKAFLELEKPFRMQIEPPAEGEFSLGHVVATEAALPQGWYEAEVKLEDLHTDKVGLVYAGRDVPEDGRARGIFQVPDFSQDPIPVSEVLSAWQILPSEGGSGPFQRGAQAVIPNPSRTYGLYNERATFYYEFSGSSGADPIFATARVEDDSGAVLLRADPAPLLSSGPSFSQTAFDIGSLPAGGYDLVLVVGGGSHPEVERRVRFNVAWRLYTWRGDAHDRVDEVHFLVDDQDEEDRFTERTPGEQEAILNAYWKERDPDPTTVENEERERFYERVFYVNQHYDMPGIEKGMFTDRGRIYIRFGPPDDIRREVMPTHGLQVDDIAKEITESRGFEFAAPLKGRGNIGADMRSFEVWTYDRLLSPTTEEARDVGPSAPLRRVFIFVDEEGYGNFLLRYSNE